MSDSKSDPTPEEIAQARELVERRVKEEGAATPPATTPAVDHEFVKRCLYAGQKGDGLMFAAMHRGRLLCAPELKGQWFEWTGSYWKQVTVYRAEAAVEAVVARYDETRLHFEAQIAEARQAHDDETVKRLDKLCKRLRKNIDDLREGSGVTASLRFALSNDDPLLVRMEDFDADPYLLGVANGVVDLRTGEFRDARPTDLLRRTCGVAWEGIDAPCPTWDAFVTEIVGEDPEVAAFIQRVFGYAAAGLSSEPLFVVLAGEGRNGKTVMVETLGKVLGDYMGPIPAELLLDQGQARDADKPTPTIMSLNGLRIAYAAETDDNRRFSISRVKWLSGDDRLTGRYMWDRDPSSFYPTHTLFLLTNHRPHAGAHEYAFWDRLRLVNFPFRYVDNPKGEGERLRDRTLPARLEQELPGILAWLVRGCLLWQSEGILPPKSVLAATEEYKREEDHIQDFVEECLIRTPEEKDTRVTATAIYELYTRWHLKNRGKYVPTMNTFGKHLGRKIHKERRGGVIYYYEVRLNPDAEDAYPEKNSKDKGFDLSGWGDKPAW
ncbi:DNA primase/helicase, phage-associated [Desulfovibrio sp. DV]|uniref:DNA primase family protein n=1 Tax=Desulfovibrio sp. DV TaxID=1844708 RepID=UPI00094BBA4C|nr:phage/plasmid primase, P4 family [Desulfovibrio sp. DV]OLN31301.1 DNA primase/helicase, phage-associated [Desulfovibrio sp. DV]